MIIKCILYITWVTHITNMIIQKTMAYSFYKIITIYIWKCQDPLWSQVMNITFHEETSYQKAQLISGEASPFSDSMAKPKRQWAEFIFQHLTWTHSLTSLNIIFIVHQMKKDSTVNFCFPCSQKGLARIIQKLHIMEKAFVFGSGMHHTIHCLGSKFIFRMGLFLK